MPEREAPPMHVHTPIALKLKRWFDSIPLVTKTVLTVCLATFVLDSLLGQREILAVCLSPSLALGKWQLHRVLTSPFFHMGILHIAFNMLTFVPIGQSLEQSIGSVQLGHLILVLVLLGATCYTAIAEVIAIAHIWPRARLECAVGFSGVVFGLLAIQAHSLGDVSQSVYGVVYIPAKWYPWALLLLCQLVLPNATFLGHLAGLVVGELWARGYLQPLSLSSRTVNYAEDTATSFSHLKSFVSASNLPTSASNTRQHGNTGVVAGSGGLVQRTTEWLRRFRSEGRHDGPASSTAGRANTLGAKQDDSRNDELPQQRAVPEGVCVTVDQPQNADEVVDVEVRRAALAAAAEARIQRESKTSQEPTV